METPKKFIFSLLYITTFLPFSTLSLRYLSLNPSPNPCDPKTRASPHSLRSDQLTVLINGYSELRIPVLTTIAGSYASLPIVANVVVLWGDPQTPQNTLDFLSSNLSLLYSSVTVFRQKSKSLNSRFLPRRWIKTRGVLICDDDVEVDPKSVEFAFNVWRVNQERLIGLFARSHGLDLRRKEWMYTVDYERYSIVLTKFMMLSVDYLYYYSCGNFSEVRGVVDKMRNCEDILMNFVVADVSGRGPLLVGAGRVRDWGDPRNEVARGEKEVDVGLSGVKRGFGEHRKRRGACIREFHKILGRMPLRYTYGKMVNSLSEQGLCNKGGKLVSCDQQIDFHCAEELGVHLTIICMASSVVSSGALVTLDELNPSSPHLQNGASLRVTGKLLNYTVETAVAVIADGSATLKIDTQHLPLNYRVGSLYQFIGELFFESENQPILKARVGRNVDGMDLNLYRQSLRLLKEFQAGQP